jgi:hypothetical protein
MSDRHVLPEIEVVLHRTLAFEEALLAPIDRVPFENTARTKLSFFFLGLAHEHWMSLRTLMASGLNHSAIALMRPQFEAVLKAFWVSHVATEAWSAAYGVVRQHKGAIIEPDMPRVFEMLNELKDTCHPKALGQLKGFKDVSWKALNSYIHGGVHALSNLTSDMPAAFLRQVLVNANGIAGLGATLAATLINDPARIHAVIGAQFAFLDCLPPTSAATTAA